LIEKTDSFWKIVAPIQKHPLTIKSEKIFILQKSEYFS